MAAFDWLACIIQLQSRKADDLRSPEPLMIFVTVGAHVDRCGTNPARTELIELGSYLKAGQRQISAPEVLDAWNSFDFAMLCQP